MDTHYILTLLAVPAAQRGVAAAAIRAQADTAHIIAALWVTTGEWAQQVLCDILGERHAADAVDVLILRLGDRSAKVSSAAADALAKIGDARAGAPLLAHFEDPQTPLPTRQMIAVALGAVGWREAIPSLIAVLASEDGSLRGAAAWSLGVLNAKEASTALVAALVRETLPYAAQRMREALAQLHQN